MNKLKATPPSQIRSIDDLLGALGQGLTPPKPGTSATQPKQATPTAPTRTVASPLMASKDLLHALENKLMEAPEGEESPKVAAAVTPLRYQAATVVAKTLGGSRISGPNLDFKISAGTPEQMINYGLRAFLRSSHTPETWQDAGKMLQLARQMGIAWDESMLSPSHRKVMNLG